MWFRYLPIIFLLCCLPMSCLAQATPEAAKILALENKWTDAYRLRSFNALTSMLADDFVITVEDGRVFGKIGYLAHTADTSVHVELAEQSDLRVHFYGNVAV